MRTIEDELHTIATEGWLVNNLFQLEPFFWRASLRNENLAFEFGEGETPQAALARALEKTLGKGFNLHDKRFPMGIGPQELRIEDLDL